MSRKLAQMLVHLTSIKEIVQKNLSWICILLARITSKKPQPTTSSNQLARRFVMTEILNDKNYLQTDVLHISQTSFWVFPFFASERVKDKSKWLFCLNYTTEQSSEM